MYKKKIENIVIKSLQIKDPNQDFNTSQLHAFFKILFMDNDIPNSHVCVLITQYIKLTDKITTNFLVFIEPNYK